MDTATYAESVESQEFIDKIQIHSMHEGGFVGSIKMGKIPSGLIVDINGPKGINIVMTPVEFWSLIEALKSKGSDNNG